MRPLVHPGSLPALALATLALAGCGAPSALGNPCGGAVSCATGTCVAGRCRPSNVAPSTADAVRILLPPQVFAVLASRSGSGAREAASAKGAVPEVIALGRADTGSLVVLLRFVPTWRDDADVASAFLTMEPLEGAPPARASTTVEIARVLEPWSSETASWGRQPRLGVPELAAMLAGHPAQRLRVDVTAIVRAWPRRAKDDHGIALLAHGDDPCGRVFSTGVAAGAGPRLEVYVR